MCFNASWHVGTRVLNIWRCRMACDEFCTPNLLKVRAPVQWRECGGALTPKLALGMAVQAGDVVL